VWHLVKGNVERGAELVANRRALGQARYQVICHVAWAQNPCYSLGRPRLHLGQHIIKLGKLGLQLCLNLALVLLERRLDLAWF
jgi:hypothetical protein